MSQLQQDAEHWRKIAMEQVERVESTKQYIREQNKRLGILSLDELAAGLRKRQEQNASHIVHMQDFQLQVPSHLLPGAQEVVENLKQEGRFLHNLYELVAFVFSQPEAKQKWNAKA